MTDWLNVEDVRAAVAKAVATTGKRSHAATTDYHRMNAWQVLEALAELPEPDECDGCGDPRDWHPNDSEAFCEDWVESQLHNIWRIARIVCGKEES